MKSWRGEEKIKRDIMEGDEEKGMMIMKMDEGIDKGNVEMEEKVEIKKDMKEGEMNDRMRMIGDEMMIREMGEIERERIELKKKEEEGVNYEEKIEKEEERIEW